MTQFRLVNGQDRIAEKGEIGRLLLRCSVWGKSQVSDTTDRIAGKTATEWFDTGDYAVAAGQGMIRILLRHDGLIRRGPVELAPQVLERSLGSMPGVAGALVIGVTHPTFEEEICAVLAQSAGKAMPDDEQVTSFVLDRLGLEQVPRFIVRVPSLPWPVDEFVRARSRLEMERYLAPWLKPGQ